VRGPWEYEDPSCASVGGNFWFPEKTYEDGTGTVFNFQSEEVKIAKSVCNSCIHKIECQQWGLKHEYHGIWGGLSDSERRPIRQKLNIIVKEVGVVNFTTGVGNSPYESNTSS
jgi:hypothetical protein